MNYFAYGSNCNPVIMDRKRVRFTSRRRARLTGYRLLFNKMALREHLPDAVGYANVNPDEGSVVEGVLYEIVDEDLLRLDQSERHPEHYNRIAATVETDDVLVACHLYQAQPNKTAYGLVPTRDYLNLILAADDILSPRYLEALRRLSAYAV